MNWIKTRWLNVPVELKKVKQFGLILGGLLFFFGLIALLRGHRHYYVEWPLGGAVFLITLLLPSVLVLIYRTWMLLALGISWVMLRIILGVLFYVVISPVSIVMRLTGKDLLDETIDRGAKSYWQKKSGRVSREQYERLY